MLLKWDSHLSPPMLDCMAESAERWSRLVNKNVRITKMGLWRNMAERSTMGECHTQDGLLWDVRNPTAMRMLQCSSVPVSTANAPVSGALERPNRMVVNP
jgi:hypothetical protein